jgi:hypothetical protein
MAERKSGADFVARIVKDPANPPQTAMLTGYVGASSEAGHTRLYFDPGLSSYFEIPNDAILHRQDADDASGLGATHLWVRRDAELIYGPAGTERPKGKFLEGPIMQAHMAGAVGAGAAAGAAITLPICGHPTLLVNCFTPHCPPTPIVHCPTQLCSWAPPCPPTPHAPCPTPLCSWAPPCHVITPLCPVATGTCPTFAGCPVGPSAACQVGAGAVAQPFAAAHAAAPVTMPVQVCATPPQTVLGCPTHAPFLCPQTQVNCPTHAPFLCPHTQVNCPTHAPFLCPHTQINCPTHPPFFCPHPTLPAACASVHIGCPTHAPFLCPTGHLGCPTHAPFLCPVAG